jgi:hypothetical protein
MAVYTFSTRATKPADTALVDRVKQQCDHKGMNFSALIIRLLREHEDGQRAREVSDSKSAS